MKKTFVLDTNVLLHDPFALHRFQDNEVILPITIIEELDRFKKRQDETGSNARQVSRTLDQLRQQGSLTDGISLESGGILRVALCRRETLQTLPLELEGDKDDNAILAVALEQKRHCECPVVLVSKDTNLRIKGDTLGLLAEDYETDKIDVEGLYSGMAEVLVESDQFTELFQSGKITLEGKYHPNQALTLVDVTNPSHTALAMVKGNTAQEEITVVPVAKIPHHGISHIHARNREQQFAFNLLLNDDISLVTLVGKAGTGKTLLAIAAGLHKVAEEQHYHRLLIARPIVPMGRDLGYLPGDVNEKLNPWMQPLFDNFDLIFGTQETTSKPSYWRRGHEELIERGLLQIEALTYIRGRTLPKQFLIVDEAQNLTPHEVKTILSRAGEGTKVILTGDIAQIDNPYVDGASNGLAHVVERFKNEPLAGHVLLKRGERSTLADRATMLL